MPRLRAFTRRAASVRLVSLAISLTGVFAFECARSSFRSVLLYSRRARFLGAFTVFFTFLATAPSRLFWNHLLPIDGYAPQGDIYEAPPQDRDNTCRLGMAQPPEITSRPVFLPSDGASFATGAGRRRRWPRADPSRGASPRKVKRATIGLLTRYPSCF